VKVPRDRDQDWWRSRYPQSSGPREAHGGIKAHSRRGHFGATWWARRWLQVLESLELGGRLSRGRAYARRGQVLDIAIDEGRVTATVQGSRKDPYAVTIRVTALSASAWRKVGEALCREARYAAKLLASEMPEDIEGAFTRAGVSLFPARRRELLTECSCPDWSNPCKHIAAVYYLLGEEFDRDPFLVFRLRGLSREGLVALLGSMAPARRGARGKDARIDAAPEAAPASPDPLALDSTAFWSGGEKPPPAEVRAPDAAAALLKRLGPFPFWRSAAPLATLLEPIYVQASRTGLDAYVGTLDRRPRS
jgi:uncharacterized Zn finger protein